MFGRQPVVDREHRQVEFARHLGAERLVGVEIAEHEAAAMAEQHERPRLALRPRVVEPEPDLPAGPGQERSRIRASSPVGASATWREAMHHPARLDRPDLIGLRARQGVQPVEKLPHVGAHIGVAQAAILQSNRCRTLISQAATCCPQRPRGLGSGHAYRFRRTSRGHGQTLSHPRRSQVRRAARSGRRPLRRRQRRRHAADRRPVHALDRAGRQRSRHLPRFPGRDPRAAGDDLRRLRLPDQFRLGRDRDGGRRARRADRDEPGGAEDQCRRSEARRPDHRRRRRVRRPQPRQGGL